MAFKKSIFLANPSVEWIEATATRFDLGEGTKWSEAINATFEQLIFLLEDALPTLAVTEWEALLNLYKDYQFPAHGVPAQVARDLMSDGKVIDLSQLKDKEAALARKVHAYTQVQQMAILYVIQLLQPLPRAEIASLLNEKKRLTLASCVETRLTAYHQFS